MPNPNPNYIPRYWKYSLDGGSFDVFCPPEVTAEELPDLLAFIDILRLQVARLSCIAEPEMEDGDWPKQYVVPCPGCKHSMSYLPSEGFAWRCDNKKCRFSRPVIAGENSP